jgi:hypothetical protein
MLPPDPLEVVHLEQEEGDDPEENFGVRHAVQRIDAPALRAMGRAAQSPRLPVLRVRGEAVLGGTAPPRSFRSLERAAAAADAARKHADQPDQRDDRGCDEEPMKDEPTGHESQRKYE